MLLQVPDCPKCGGVLKPKMKFLGDRVGKDVMDFLFGKIKECDHMLVIGTSLQVGLYSFRTCNTRV